MLVSRMLSMRLENVFSPTAPNSYSTSAESCGTHTVQRRLAAVQLHLGLLCEKLAAERVCRRVVLSDAWRGHREQRQVEMHSEHHRPSSRTIIVRSCHEQQGPSGDRVCTVCSPACSSGRATSIVCHGSTK